MVLGVTKIGLALEGGIGVGDVVVVAIRAQGSDGWEAWLSLCVAAHGGVMNVGSFSAEEARCGVLLRRNRTTADRTGEKRPSNLAGR
jgi:hypothetical protein